MNNAILNCNIAIMNNHATNFLSLKSNFHISTTFPVLTSYRNHRSIPSVKERNKTTGYKLL